jgi:hypothetical protein
MHGRPPTRPIRGVQSLVRPPFVRHSARVTGRNWKELAAQVVARRVELGYESRAAFARVLVGVSDKTLGVLENGGSVSANTLAKVEHALDWAPGSAEAILSGGAPRPRPTPGPAGPAAPDDLKEQLRRLWRSTTPERFFSTVSALAAEMEAERVTPGNEANENS